MKKLLAAAKAAAARYVPQAVQYLWKKYPARVASGVAAVVVFVAAQAGVVVDQESVVNAVLLVVPILLAGQYTHRKVTPVATVEKPAPLEGE